MKIKMIPVKNIINFELPAQTLVNGLDPKNNPLKKSAPPSVMKKAMTTTICIKSFFLFENLSERNEKTVNKSPKIDGIRDVKD